ncbi:SAM-dependent methyltransferase [Nonomuraea sp. SBT364]|uniref:SAM-dependent methyltransferase n=1 Tax=Nonomuraea sp. SBT364 TaxID=1580530 RepID=UPI00066B187C|nr:SAM-dependent methyltransferase [Nonomuraea sp. SBT364]
MSADDFAQQINPNVPSVARMYDYYLGGKDNFPADREAAERIVRLARESGSDIREVARANRGFLIRGVRHLAEAGVRQFLDIGTGLPTQDNVHQVVQRVTPEAKVVYVDNDPIVLSHARALLADNPGTVIVAGDLREPGYVLKEAAGHLDFSRPVAVVVAAVLHFVQDDAEAERIVRALRGPLVPGSHLMISHAYIEPGQGEADRADEVRGVYRRSTSGALAWRDRETVRAYFDGLDLLDPGVVPAQRWRDDDPGDWPGLAKGGVLAGIARVP